MDVIQESTSQMDDLFRRVFKSNVIRRLIFSWVNRIHIANGVVHYRYTQLTSIVICNLKIFDLLRDKIKYDKRFTFSPKAVGKFISNNKSYEIFNMVHQRWPQHFYPPGQLNLLEQACLVKGIDVRIIETLDNIGSFQRDDCIFNACKSGNERVFDYLMNQDRLKFKLTSLPMDYATENFNIIIKLHNASKGDKLYSSQFLPNAIDSNNMDSIKFGIETLSIVPKSSDLDNAADVGSLEILKFLEKFPNMVYSDKAIGLASANGHYDVVEYLINRKAPISPQAVEKACLGGHLPIVQLLTVNKAPSSVHALNYVLTRAKNSKYTEIAKYLIKNRTEGCSDKPLQTCVWNGNFELLVLFYDYPHKPMEDEMVVFSSALSYWSTNHSGDIVLSLTKRIDFFSLRGEVLKSLIRYILYPDGKKVLDYILEDNKKAERIFSNSNVLADACRMKNTSIVKSLINGDLKKFLRYQSITPNMFIDSLENYEILVYLFENLPNEIPTNIFLKVFALHDHRPFKYLVEKFRFPPGRTFEEIPKPTLLKEVKSPNPKYQLLQTLLFNHFITIDDIKNNSPKFHTSSMKRIIEQYLQSQLGNKK